MRDRLSPMVPLSVQLAPQRAAQIMCLWVCDNLRMQCSFSLQIKYPLYSAHSSAKRVTKYLWQPAAMRKKVFRLGPFSFATPAFTGCAFVCTCTPSRSHAQNFTIFSVGRYAGLHTQPFARAEQKSSGSFSSVYHKCPQITSKYL